MESSFAQLSQASAPALGKGKALTYFLDAMKAQQQNKPKRTQLHAKALTQLDAQIAVSPLYTELQELKAQLARLSPE